MAKKSGTKHLKRIAMPKSFGLPRKEFTWSINPLPGRHKKELSLPLLHAIIALGFAKTAKEAKAVLNTRQVKIDGIVRTEPKHLVGLMDIITIGENNWRVLVDTKGKIKFEKTSNPSVKLCQVRNKTKIKGGKIQLTLHDGRNILDFDAKVGDTIEISIPEGKPIGKIELKKSSLCFITGGKKIGNLIKIKEISPGSATRNSEIHGELLDGSSAITLTKYAFPVKENFI
ncbi:MAG: S4 domain-containing protein [Candidatus Micrarchaeia archaeon]